MKRFLILLILFFAFSTKANAVYNPQDIPNNKFGIHILEQSDISDAGKLVNSTGGRWGYVTLVIRDDQRQLEQWSSFFKELRTNHLIPIVRIATHVENSTWVKPNKEEAKRWSSFLDNLNWPTKNRYIVLFNEPNHAKEWGNSIDPAEYAEIASIYIRSLKLTSNEFFILNAGFDLAASNIEGETADALWYWEKMEEHSPGIFNLFDGWSSHSYPNPAFSASPYKTGRSSIVGYKFEQEYLKDRFDVEFKPVFITETGWVTGKYGVPETQAAQYYKIAYDEIWTDDNLIAVTPFLLNYPEDLFASFSWKDKDGKLKEQYISVSSLEKQEGQPVLSPISLFGKLIAKVKEPPKKLSQIPDPLF